MAKLDGVFVKKDKNEESRRSLTDEQIVTEKNLPRRSFLAATGAAIVGGAAALVLGRSSTAQAQEPDKPKTTDDPDKAKAPDQAKAQDPDKAKSQDPDKAKAAGKGKGKSKAKTKDPDKAKPQDPDKAKSADPDKGKD